MTELKKLKYVLAAILSASALFSCDPVTPVDPDDPGTTPAPEPQTLKLSFVLPSGGAKQTWTAGDEIVVHGEFAAQQVTVKLAASDISSDGKTATLEVQDLYPYVREDVSSTLYAAYPASAVDNLRHCFFYSKFSTTAEELLAAYNDSENVFRFQQVCGSIQFTVDGGYDSFTFAGNKKESLGYGFMQVQLTDKNQNFNQYRGDPLLVLDRAAAPVNRIYVPAGTQIKNGFIIKFRKDGKFVKAYRSAESFTVTNGQTIDLGDITSGVEDYDDPFSSDILDLDTDGNANCYIISAPGAYKFKAVYGNSSTDFIEDVASASVLWETWNNAEEVEEGSVVKSVSYAEDYVILHTPDVLRPGNAVVAVRKLDGTILWSWHIWVPATAITTDTYGGIFGPEAMSRNLGALIDAEAGSEVVPPEAFGLTYFWGRKDPFPGPKELKSSSAATVAGLEAVVAPGQITLAEAVADPLLMGHIDNGDWLYPADSGLWDNEDKTIYDPCPAGYRVPKRDTTKPFWSSNQTSAEGWEANTEFGWLTIGNPKAVFPVGGYRDDYAVGGFTHCYDRVLYWTAYSSSDSKAFSEDIRIGSSCTMKENPKARGGYIRCVAE